METLTDLHGRDEAVHVEATVTVVTEQQLVVILGRATQGARLAFYRRKIRLI